MLQTLYFCDFSGGGGGGGGQDPPSGSAKVIIKFKRILQYLPLIGNREFVNRSGLLIYVPVVQ